MVLYYYGLVRDGSFGSKVSTIRVETIAEEEDPFFNVENIPSMWIFQNKC